MKKLGLLILFTFLFISPFIYSQEQIPVLTHEMTPEEELRRNEIGRDFTPTAKHNISNQSGVTKMSRKTP